ncbi:MAG: RNA-binding protein [Chloroflexi bacterium]|nr:MAG: RNA-binding protein [SAR202 cluster bacterium]MAO75738.1 RNA-binding protein [Chloroflexota bacterium]MBG54497.1 RNA-binding protein [Chloroflexota bacterium]MBR49197.1 RNA-binding protein [Chloroflexota bacterium]
MNIYVGNISYNSSEDDLRDLFGRYGEVVDVRIITDRDSGRSKGFGFVEMSDDDQAKEAIEALDSKDFMGRDIRVNEARPREPRS